MPNRWAVESRPLRTEPCPFLCAIAVNSYKSEKPTRSGGWAFTPRNVGVSLRRGRAAGSASAAATVGLRGVRLGVRGLHAGAAVDPLVRRHKANRLRVLDAGVGPAGEVQLQRLAADDPLGTYVPAVRQAADENGE